MSIQKGPIQVMIGLIFKEKQQLALVIKNPSHQVRHLKNKLRSLIQVQSKQSKIQKKRKKNYFIAILLLAQAFFYQLSRVICEL